MELSKRILVVDDETHILKSVERIFLECDDVEIFTTVSPIKAIEILKKDNIAVIITDNMMSEMMGMELLTKVKLLSPDTVRILMTGYADLNTAIEAINTNEVFRFIVKPWDNSAFKAAVNEGISKYNLVRSLKNVNEGTMLSLAQTIELKDHYTRGHCERVAKYALYISGKLDISDEEMVSIKYGAWLHDCGKIGVPESILNNINPLCDEDMAIIKKHPVWGADVIEYAQMPDAVKNIILYHHERFDGKGYPAGLAGEEIPLEARIVAVADIYDALTSDRPYRVRYGNDKAKDVLLSMTGSNLDLGIVESFLYSLDEDDPLNEE